MEIWSYVENLYIPYDPAITDFYWGPGGYPTDLNGEYQ
jgi:hypothetical protein